MKTDRQQAIMDYIGILGEVSINDLSDHFQVSLNTIRRDTSDLANRGLISRQHGTVRIIRQNERSYQKRYVTNLDEKIEIARYCATKVEDNDLIFIDAGTTTGLVSKYIPESYHITIFTNNFNIVDEAKDKTNWKIYLIGSVFRHSSYSFVKVENWAVIDNVNLTKGFFGATGFSLKSGATNPEQLETEIKSHMIKRCRDCYLMTDNSKFGAVSLYTFAQPNSFKEVVTVGSIAKSYSTYFAENQITLTTLTPNNKKQVRKIK